MEKVSGFLSSSNLSSGFSSATSGLSSVVSSPLDFVKGNSSGSGLGVGGSVAGGATNAVASGMNFVTGAENDEGLFPGLSFKQRLIGFVTCLISGFLLLLLSTMFIILPRQFGKFYTLGSLSLLLSTMFLVGPMRQLRAMFAPQRAASSIIYLVALVGTLYTALYLRKTGATLGMVTVQLCAAVWYAASYLPFAQACLAKATKSLLPL